jgi:hypothetical protein
VRLSDWVLVVAGALAIIASPAQAGPCLESDGCAGFYSGNLLNGSPTDIVAQQAALASLGYEWDGDFGALLQLPHQTPGLEEVDLSSLLHDFVGIHWGGGHGDAGNVTAFYRLDDAAALDAFSLKYHAGGNAVLYPTSGAVPVTVAVAVVPEPATYVLVIFALAALGWTRRRGVMA